PAAQLRLPVREDRRARDAAQLEAQRRRLVRVGSELRRQRQRAPAVLRRPGDDEHGDRAHRTHERRRRAALLLPPPARRPLRDDHPPTARKLAERRRRARHARAHGAARGVHRELPRAVLVDPSALQEPAGAAAGSLRGHLKRMQTNDGGDTAATAPPAKTELADSAPAEESAAIPSLAAFRSPRWWPVWLMWLAMLGIARLPFAWQVTIGRGIGRALRHVKRREARTAARNLELCFPNLDAAARRALLFRHFEAVGMSFLEMAIGWTWPIERLLRHVEIKGREHLEAALAADRGVLLVSAHFTPME